MKQHNQLFGQIWQFLCFQLKQILQMDPGRGAPWTVILVQLYLAYFSLYFIGRNTTTYKTFLQPVEGRGSPWEVLQLQMLKTQGGLMYLRGNSYFHFAHPFALPPKHPAIAGVFIPSHPRSSPAKLQCLLYCFKCLLLCLLYFK